MNRGISGKTLGNSGFSRFFGCLVYSISDDGLTNDDGSSISNAVSIFKWCLSVGFFEGTNKKTDVVKTAL